MKKKPVKIKDKVHVSNTPSCSPPPEGGECSHQQLKRLMTTTPTVTSSISITRTVHRDRRINTFKLQMDSDFTKWISINLKTPEVFVYVIANCINKTNSATGFVCEARIEFASGAEYTWTDKTGARVFVTHWMPKPEPVPVIYKEYIVDPDTFYFPVLEEIDYGKDHFGSNVTETPSCTA